MKAVIPAAGQGTRLYPQTHTKPKPMVRVAGKPILGHILDGLVESPIDEAVVVVGVMKDHVIDYARENYGDRLDLSFAEQNQTEGLGHCIYQTRDLVSDDPICIVLGDMLFDGDYGDFLVEHERLGDVDGSIGVKVVEEPSNYGVVTVEGNRIVELVEKPEQPASNLAISGIYFIEDTSGLFDALTYLIENDVRGAGDEYQLTDALQRMIEQGAEFGMFEVEDWYDCGRPSTLLEANRVLLERTAEPTETPTDTSVVIPPVDIGEDVEILRSVVGPYVSIDDGARIEDSRVENGIIGGDSDLSAVNLSETIVGNNSSVVGTPTHLNVGDSSEVHL
ncbi:sugar phosphate nucleotidyltransferase [Haloplanus sp. GCM10025708]|uniref:sugar phosphate nucleotidyltransferase n=1 Tax=Haloferacaceae TaxID=1644056 RepID=UPI0036126E9F